ALLAAEADCSAASPAETGCADAVRWSEAGLLPGVGRDCWTANGTVPAASEGREPAVILGSMVVSGASDSVSSSAEGPASDLGDDFKSSRAGDFKSSWAGDSWAEVADGCESSCAAGAVSVGDFESSWAGGSGRACSWSSDGGLSGPVGPGWEASRPSRGMIPVASG